MFIGYARVSTTDQNPALQLEALKSAGCERIFTDEGISGGAIKRPALDKALAALKSGDVLIVWKLDRLGRSLSHLIQITKQLGERDIGFRSLSESIDTTSASGRLLFHIIGALAEFERALITERTRAGMASAKRRGAKVGRKPKLSPDQIDHIKKLIDAGESPRNVAKSMGISTATLYRKIPAAASNRTTLDLFTNTGQ
ncbi:Site-specific DNA recombinase [Nitrosospira multiformis]|uniref:Site-specific DNA recombinase n=1 Tax=Nitrosospira multiformis TaxID=1231 RepID=A0A1H8Q3J4_9PROT|nr:recombinase family protein [Nitrosospira multiformis]SEO48636.1 Site-specific DNA recombinase [Nitrosospira multiformis]